jgi:hypothetical protein
LIGLSSFKKSTASTQEPNKASGKSKRGVDGTETKINFNSLRNDNNNNNNNNKEQKKMATKNTLVVGGRMELVEVDGKKVEVFREKRRLVIETANLGALMRRDHELCGLPIVRFSDTLQNPNHGQFFAANRGGN